MKPASLSIRARLVFSLTLIFAALAFVAFYIQTQTLEQSANIADRGRRISNVQLVKLYFELSFPGTWRSHEGYLFKGPQHLIDGSAHSFLLTDYMPPDTMIRFRTGEPPSEYKRVPRPSIIFEQPIPPSPELLQQRGMHELDIPFITENGAGITVREENSLIVGWIYVESGQNPNAPQLNRFRQIFLFSAAGLYIAVITVFGALVLHITRPVGKIAMAHEHVKAKNAELANQSRKDPLTGLLNRRGINEILSNSNEDDQTPSHVAIIDVDHFKAVNDEHGHTAGDRVLIDIAEIISASVRRGDLCGRWGGEEFIIVFRGLDDASASAERIRTNIEAHTFGSLESPLRVTITIGVASMAGRDLHDSVAVADDAMYRGKREGRNRVINARE